LIEAAYINPAAYGNLSGINLWVWILSHVFADMKFMALFPMMFGAGVYLITSRAEVKGRSAAGLHYRRTFWLLVFGLLHAHLLWYGDILYTYAVCALLLFLFRKISPTKLIVLGILLLLIPTLVNLLVGFAIPYMPPEAYQDMSADWKPDQEAVEAELDIMKSGWLTQMIQRVPTSLGFQTFIFLVFLGWRAGGMMLIGMGLFKMGVFSAERSLRFYSILASAGFAIGLPLISYGVLKNFGAGWTLDYSMFFGGLFNYWGSIAVALAYVGIVMIGCKLLKNRWLRTSLAAAGRMALSCYLLQTIICTTLFYGHGFGLFGRVERVWQIAIVFAVWLALLLWCRWWLTRFKFGPFEWVWRSLTYWKAQPIRVGNH
jgi:uncharacterized protein